MQAVHPIGRPMQMRRIPVTTMRGRPCQAVYRRRRIAVLLCAASIVGAAWLGMHQLAGTLGGGSLTAAEQPASNLSTQLVGRVRLIVQPGDTLWSLARRAQPTGDIRPLVDQLSKARHGKVLMAGETIEIPAK